VAALGSVFATHMNNAPPATLTAHYATSLNTLLLITACAASAVGRVAPAETEP
jgi:hypothetical protein